MWRLASVVLLAGCTATAQQVTGLPVQIARDTASVMRYGLDVSLLESAGVVVACYLTNPKRWKGPPSLSCVAVPVTR